MSKFKKIAAALLAGAMVASMSLTAFAASGISATEQKLLDKAASIKAGYTLTPAAEKKYNDAVAQAKSYLESNELSETQVNSVLSAMSDAEGVVKAAAADGDLSALTKAAKSDLLAKVAAALQKGADAAGLKITIAADGSATIKSATNNKPVGSTTDTVKATGATASATVAVIAALVVVLGGCALFAKKRNMFA